MLLRWGPGQALAASRATQGRTSRGLQLGADREFLNRSRSNGKTRGSARPYAPSWCCHMAPVVVQRTESTIRPRAFEAAWSPLRDA